MPGPRRFGPYVVLGELGSGGMGAVYRALDTRLERQVAVKVLHRETAVSGPRERFLREARIVSSLNHPNICTVFDIGDEDGDPYLVMELLHGESLKDRVLRGPVPPEDIREIAFRVGLALQAAHAKGIIHRDIKPANLFLVDDGRGALDVKVLDFGLAKVESSDRRVSVDGLTREGATVGTVEYMSPEQACGEPLDARSDLFSLGAVLYEMATGVVPFPGATSAIIFSELLNRDPTPPRERNLTLPWDLDRLIRSLLVKDRERRMQSASAMLQALSEGSTEYEARRLASLRRPTAAVQVPLPAALPLAAPKLAPIETQPLQRQPVQERAVQGQPVQGRPVQDQPFQGRPVHAAPVALESAEHTVPQPAAAVSSRPRLPAGPLPEPRVSVPLPAAPRPEELADPQPAFGGKPRGVSGSGAAVRTASPSEHGTAVAAGPARVSAAWKVALVAVVAVVLLLTLLVILLLYRRPATAALNGALQMVPIVNQTGNAALDRAPTAGLQLLLAESPRFAVRPPAAADVLSGGTADASQQQVRQALGLEGVPNIGLAVLTGTLSHGEDGYVLDLRVTDPATQASLAETRDAVQSVAELPVLLTQSASRLRVELGEPAEAVESNAPLLGEEASSALPALADFAEAQGNEAMGNLPAAIAAYRRALAADAHFQTAEIRLAAALRRVHAEEGAAAVLRVLQQQPTQGGSHLRSARAYALAGSAPVTNPAAPGTLAEQWRSARPHDVEAQRAAATERLLGGRYPEAVVAAGEAVALDPFSRANQDLLTAAQLSAGHADAAWTTEARAYRLGGGSAELSLAAAYLRGDEPGREASLRNLREESGDPAAVLSEAVYLDNAGQPGAATPVYALAAAVAVAHPETASAAAVISRQGGLNAALAGRCAATAESPLAAAWCGVAAADRSSESGDDAFREAAAHWAAGDLRSALQALHGQARGDVLATLLRGRLHQLLQEPDAAVAEYRAITAQRGAAYLSGYIAYPVALAGLAAVYAETGDTANRDSSAAALRSLWPDRSAAEVLLRSMARS